MASVDLQECDRLEGTSNFTSWKCRMQTLLEEVDLWSLIGVQWVSNKLNP
jgi:hypothetical protein